MNTKNESHALRRASAPTRLPNACEGREFTRTNANAANSAAILPSSLSARHTAGRGDGFILPGRLNRVGPGVGEVPTSRPGIIFRQRVLPVVFLASATAAVCAGTWRYWATFHKDDSSFLGFFGVALCCGSLATHFANERRAA